MGNTVKFGFCNTMATVLGGQYGIISMSLCIQTLSIISIFLTGAIDTIQPLRLCCVLRMTILAWAVMLRKTLWIVLWISLPLSF